MMVLDMSLIIVIAFEALFFIMLVPGLLWTSQNCGIVDIISYVHMHCHR